MPEPTSIYSTDKYIYDYIVNPIASNICFIEPNYITFVAILLTIPTLLGLFENWSTSTMVMIFILRAFLDCLDGAVARKCNKFSDFGANLDLFGDKLFTYSYMLVMIYLLYNKSDANKYIGLIAITLLICFINIDKHDIWGYIYGDNTIIGSGLIIYIFSTFNNSII